MAGRGVIDEGMRAYYEQRAAEYDDWWLGRGVFAERDRPGWHEEGETGLDAVRALEPKRTLDVACGTAFVTRHLRGEVVGLDQSETMVQIAASRLPAGAAGGRARPGRRGPAAVRGPLVRPRLHRPLLRASARGRARALPRRGAPR